MAPFLALAGFMASGKSSVGRRVADLLAWDFVDLDEVVVEAAGLPIEEYFASQGERAFRQLECSVLSRVLGCAPGRRGLVLALGGGTLESPEAAEMLANRGSAVFLDVAAEEAWARAAGTGRPLAVDAERFRGLLERRRPAYEAFADWVLPVEGRSVDELAEEIAGILRLPGPERQELWGRRLEATERSSFVVGGPGALETLRSYATQAREAGSRIFVITDENVMAAWGGQCARLMGGLPDDALLVVPAGEASKSASMLARCWDWLAAAGARRDDVVVALGGGVIGDLAGFAAATYQRGVTLWQVPTTLLAQVDSSIGGKTAIDLSAGKNLVGAFYQPNLVITDPTVLITLSDRDYAGGLAEVIKHTILQPPAFLDRLEREAAHVVARQPSAVSWVVKTSVAFKTGVVQRDERERGRRAILNLGHTVGHALEVVLGYGSISHGEAVALGLLVALKLSEDLLGLDPEVRRRFERLVVFFGLPASIDLPEVPLLLTAAGRDKKVRAGSSGFVGLRALGDPAWGLDVPQQRLGEAIEVIRR